MQNLTDAAERREEFIASFAHELKTPLTAIIGYADMLRSREMTPKNRFTAAGYIFSEGKRLEALSLKLMEIIVSGKQGIERRRFDAPYFIREVAAVTVPSLAADGMTLDMRWEQGEVWIEPDLFKTLMINLIDNARKASRRGQTVELFGKRAGGRLRLLCPRPRPGHEERGPEPDNRAVLYDRQVPLPRAERRGPRPGALPAHSRAARDEAGIRERAGQGHDRARLPEGRRRGVKKLKPGLYAGILTLLVFAVCLTVPALMLRGRTQEPAAQEESPSPTEVLSLAERVQLYTLYDEGQLSRRALDAEEIDGDILVAAIRRANAVENVLVADHGAQRSLSSTGTNFYTVSEGGKTIRVLEYYREWTGDWSNWFWIKLDIDTLDVFYCYYSASCERNLADYNADDYYNASALLGSFASALDYDGFQKIPEGIEDDVPFEVRLTNSAAGEERSYECRMHTYSDSASLLVDREFTLTG